jgi:hypothetical protein
MFIKALDKNYLWEKWIVDEICGINFDDYFMGKKSLTMRTLEDHIEDIIERLEKMKANINKSDDPFFYGDYVTDIRDAAIGYQILALLVLETGAFLPEKVKEEVLKSTTWEFDKEWKWAPNAINIRKFYLNEFRQKILNHGPGIQHKFIDLKINTDKGLETAVIGLEQFHEYIQSGKIKEITYINLDCCQLKEVPEELFTFSHIQRLSLEHNYLTSLPENIDNFKSLKDLYLTDNNISSLPQSIKNLKSLVIISLYNNPIDAEREIHSDFLAYKGVPYLNPSKLTNLTKDEKKKKKELLRKTLEKAFKRKYGN